MMYEIEIGFYQNSVVNLFWLFRVPHFDFYFATIKILNELYS